MRATSAISSFVASGISTSDVFSSPKNRSKAGDDRTRDRVMAAFHVRHGYTLAEIGQVAKLHYSTVSRVIARQAHAKNKTHFRFPAD